MYLVKILKKYNYGKNLQFYNLRNFKNTTLEEVPHISATAIKKVLKSSNISFKEGYTCFLTDCPICKKNKTCSSTGYVNKTTGLFMCPKCKYYDEWNIFQSFISMKEQNNPRWHDKFLNTSKIHKYLKHIENTTIHITRLKEDVFYEILNKLKLSSIEKSSLHDLNVRIDEKELTLYFPLKNANSDVVGYMVVGEDQKTLPETNCGGLLRGSKFQEENGTAILVSNLSDFLVLYTSDLKYTIICLPNGNRKLPQNYLPTLEKYSKIIIWLGNEVGSWDAARRFGKKLGEKRCHCIWPSNKYTLPHLNQAQDFEEIISNAQSLSHKSITTFASFRQDVLSDIQNIEQSEGIKWNRFPSLNKILKGHRMGELTVITGPTGCGKTTFISEYSLDLALQGVNTLWGSFEIRNTRLARTMLQQMVGKPLDKNLNLFDIWADKFEQLPIYYMTFHGQQSIKVVMDAVEHASYVYDINHVIIDNVQFMMGITEEHKHMDRFWKQDSIVAAFRTFASKRNCHVTLVIHPRKERVDEDLTTNSIFGGAKASQEADNVLIIQDKRLTGLRGKKYLQISKNRYSGDLGVIPLDFDKESLSYAQKKKLKEQTE